MNYFIECITSKYLCFEGRARRKEYWMFTLFNIIAGFVAGFIGGFLSGLTGIQALALLGALYNIAVIIPGLAVSVRRLHDIDKSGWWILIAIIPIIGWIILFVFTCLDSKPGSNKYGPNPKGV